MLNSLQNVVKTQLDSQLQQVVQRMTNLHSNYDNYNFSQYQKIQTVLKDALIKKWGQYPYSCNFYDEEKVLFLKQQIECLLELILQIENELPKQLEDALKQSNEQNKDQEKFFTFKDNPDLKISKTLMTNKDVQSIYNRKYDQNLVNDMAEQINKLEYQVSNDQITIRQLRLQKLDLDQQFKQLFNQYENGLKQNKDYHTMIQRLERDIQSLEEEHRKQQEEIEEKKKEPVVYQIPQRGSDSGNGQLYMEQKIAHLEHSVMKQQGSIQKLQDEKTTLQQELSKQQMLNQELYSRLINLDVSSEKLIKAKNRTLKELEEKNENFERRKRVREGSSVSPQKGGEQQWNRLILSISKLQNEKRMLSDKVEGLLSEIFKVSQFVLNLFEVMDKPDFIVNLENIKTVCAQQRERLSDRLIEIVKERQVGV